MAHVPTTRRYSPRRSPEERRSELLDAALALIDAGGFEAFSVEGVAREAGVSKTVVYAAYATGEELVRALLDREMARVMEDVAASFPQPPFVAPDAIARESMTRILAAVHARPRTWRLIALPSDGVPLAARETMLANRGQLLEQLRPLIAWGKGPLGIEHVDGDVLTEMILGGFEHAIRMTLTDPERYTPERMVAFLDDVVRALRSSGSP